MAMAKTEWYDLEDLVGGSHARLHDLAGYLQIDDGVGNVVRSCR